MVNSKGQSVNIELEIGINSKKSKRKSSISGNRTKRSKNSIQEDFEELENVRNDGKFISNPDKRLPGKVLVSYSYDVIYDIRGKLNDACCNLNEVVMNRIAKIESKQSEIEAKQAEILSFQQDLKSQLNDLSGNVQIMIADFLNQMAKKFYFDTEEVVLNRQIVLYSPILETHVQVEDNNGSQLKDFEVQSQVQNDRKGKGKSLFCDKTENESVHHGATEFEQDDDIIQIDDFTPSAPRRRTRKTAAVYRSPYISEFVSSGKSKAVIREIRICTSALRDEINAIDVNDIVNFEEWFNMELCKNNKKKKFNDNNKMISPPFSFGILEVVDKKWFYDLRTPEECLTDTARSSSFVDWSAYDGKDPFDELDIHILGKISQQYQSGDCGVYVIKYAEYIAHQKLGEMSKTFNLEEARLTLSVQLFKYAKRKIDEGFDTDEERVSD
ncbi:Ulp1 protease family [Forsythia ovata]|uniref:Ulp1 protease family n=1 Tax=Forsythia ovata TaxID=205694 RepID=A0ABD1TBB8_9LAMI